MVICGSYMHEFSATPNMIFSMTYYLDLHGAISFYH